MFPNITGYSTYPADKKHFCGNSIYFVVFLRQQDFWKIYSINIYGRVSNFLIYDSQMVNIQIVKSFSKPKDQVFKWWLIIAPGEILPKSSVRSCQQYNIDKYVYNFFKKEYKIQWSWCQKPNNLTKSIEIHFSRSNIFLFYFCEKTCLAVVLLTHAEEK